MIITVDEIVEQAAEGFSAGYPHFKDFQNSETYGPYWDLCMQTLQDRDLVGHIIFCNDVFHIPPAKTFLFVNQEALQEITGREDAALEDYVKKALGAFWAYVFKAIFSYNGQKSVSVSLNKMFHVKTASYYTDPQKKLILAI